MNTLIDVLDGIDPFSASEEQKIDVIVEWLTCRHLFVEGGYPHDYDWIGDTLVIADLNDAKERNQTSLAKYERKELLEWFDHAIKFLRENQNEFSLEDAFYETAP